MIRKFIRNHPRWFVPPLSIHNIFRALTGQFRIPPNFLIIGAQKCGTTSLFYYLSQHPFIKPSQKKEIYYFDRYSKLGINWYKGNFPSVIENYIFRKKHGSPFITGEATSSYIFHPALPKLISSLFPNMKIIALIRNPVDRAFSHYNNMRRVGKENLSFEKAIEEENNRIKGEEERIKNDINYFSLPLNYHAYLHHGIYFNYIKNWFDYFSRDQMMIIITEEFLANPNEVFNKVTKFLGVPEWHPKYFPKQNVGNNDEPNPQTREKLVKFFKPHNEKLSKLLKRDLGW